MIKLDSSPRLIHAHLLSQYGCLGNFCNYECRILITNIKLLTFNAVLLDDRQDISYLRGFFSDEKHANDKKDPANEI